MTECIILNKVFFLQILTVFFEYRACADKWRNGGRNDGRNDGQPKSNIAPLFQSGAIDMLNVLPTVSMSIRFTKGPNFIMVSRV